MNILDKVWISIATLIGLASNYVAFGPNFQVGVIMLLTSFALLILWAVWRA